MRNITAKRIRDDDPISDQHVWSVIHYLDPERAREEREFAVIFAGLVALIIWAILIWMLLFTDLG